MIIRILFFSYGVLSYLIFFGTFLYAVGFIGGFWVPTTLDGPPNGPLATAVAINVGLLALFALQHSVMARKWFKDGWTKIVPQPIERSTYVLFSSLALIALFWLWRPMGGVVWSVEDPVAVVILRSLFGFGWALVLITTFLINHFDLFGLRQVWYHLIGVPLPEMKFVTPGPYRMVRHPLYVGWFFVFWMMPVMTFAHLLFALATTAYILIAIQFEERDLVREHGDKYRAYKRRVPMVIPLTARGATVPAETVRSYESK